MARTRFGMFTIVLFAGVICFYYVIPQSVAYLLEALCLILATNKVKGEFNGFPVLWYGLFFIYILCDSLIRDNQLVFVSSCLNVLVFVLILCLLIKSDEDSYAFIKASAYWGILLSIFLLLRYRSYLGIGRFGMELPGTRIDSAITLGYIFLYVMCLQIYSFLQLRPSKLQKIILISGFLLTLFLTLLTGTRKAMFLPIIYLFLLILIKNKNSLGKLVLYFSVIVIVGVFTFNYLVEKEIIDSNNLARLQGSIALFSDKYELDDSTLERELLVKQAKELFYQHPLLGNGIDATLFTLTKHPHNNYMSLLSMGGILMFFLYYYIYLYCIFSPKIERKNHLSLFLIVVAVLPLSDMGTTSFNIAYFNLLITLFILTATKHRVRLQ